MTEQDSLSATSSPSPNGGGIVALSTGLGGYALICRTGEEWVLSRPGQGPISVLPAMVNHTSHLYADASFQQFDSIDAAIADLDTRIAHSRTFIFVLSVLDDDLPDDVRARSAQLAELRLATHETAESLRLILQTRLAAPDADLSGGCRIARAIAATRVAALIEGALGRQQVLSALASVREEVISRRNEEERPTAALILSEDVVVDWLASALLSGVEAEISEIVGSRLGPRLATVGGLLEAWRQAALSVRTSSDDLGATSSSDERSVAILESPIRPTHLRLVHSAVRPQPSEEARVEIGVVVAPSPQFNTPLERLRAEYDALIKTERRDVEWAAAMRDVSVGLQQLGESQRDSALLEQAVAAAERAVQLLPPNRPPREWAIASHALATALAALGELRPGGQHLERAIQTYRSVAAILHGDGSMAQWAIAQGNLGNALARLGSRQSDGAALIEAVDAYERALSQQSRTDEPRSWAMTRNNLANALLEFGQLHGDLSYIRLAVDAYRDALSVFSDPAEPIWAMAQHNLGLALRHLGEAEPDSHLLRLSVQALADAVSKVTKEEHPAVWAAFHSDLGCSLIRLGERENGEEFLARAVYSLRNAVDVLTQNDSPVDWAMAQNNLGIALSSLGERRSDTTALNDAVLAFERALEVFKPEVDPSRHSAAQSNLSAVKAALQFRLSLH